MLADGDWTFGWRDEVDIEFITALILLADWYHTDKLDHHAMPETASTGLEMYACPIALYEKNITDLFIYIIYITAH